MNMRLNNKVAIVTGGGFSIGRVFSEALAREGAAILVADINADASAETVAAIKASGGEACAVVTDVSDPSAVAEMMRACRKIYGRVDVLVNNAALAAALPPRSLDELDVAEWDAIMAVNLRGAFLCAKSAAPVMKEQGSGKIINVSSTTAYKGHEGRIAYATSKAGLLGLTRSLARALGKHGICVNALMPGSVASAGALAIQPLEHFERAATHRSIPRVQHPADLVGALVFLASSDSDFMTGQTLVIDGGVEMR
jgi:3-oxoacyl-[acyl-carrier protein] reductase